MDPKELRFRQATAADEPRIAALAVGLFSTYRAFGPPGWSPPALEFELGSARYTLGHPSAWCRLAEDGASRLAGHVAWLAASAARLPSDEPGLAHLWQLMVAEDWWGSGLAATLQAAAFEAAVQQGYTALRLFTPAGHARARRFYEREGWTLSREPYDDPAFGMPIVDYRFALGGA